MGWNCSDAEIWTKIGMMTDCSTEQHSNWGVPWTTEARVRGAAEILKAILWAGFSWASQTTSVNLYPQSLSTGTRNDEEVFFTYRLKGIPLGIPLGSADLLQIGRPFFLVASHPLVSPAKAWYAYFRYMHNHLSCTSILTKFLMITCWICFTWAIPRLIKFMTWNR